VSEVTPDFEPQATFTDIDAPKISGVNYDYEGGERSATTTMGAIKHASETSSTIPPATNLYAEGDAADPNNETNTVGSGWEDYNGGNSLTSDGTENQIGSYSLKSECTSDVLATGSNLPIDVENIKTYSLSFYYKSFVPGTSVNGPAIYQSTNCTLDINGTQLTATTWTEVTGTITATATGVAKLRFYTALGTGNIGNILWLDNIVITEN
jgi:hypothetical protein